MRTVGFTTTRTEQRFVGEGDREAVRIDVAAAKRAIAVAASIAVDPEFLNRRIIALADHNQAEAFGRSCLGAAHFARPAVNQNVSPLDKLRVDWCWAAAGAAGRSAAAGAAGRSATAPIGGYHINASCIRYDAISGTGVRLRALADGFIATKG
jgi:hypothetical protein